MSSPAAQWPQPTSDERTMATLAHALQIVGGWIAPLIIFLVKKDSLFVRFHALQAMLLHFVYIICAMIFTVIWVATIFATVFSHVADKSSAPPTAIFVLMPLMWLFLMGSWLIILICAIVFAIKANNGEWAEYPVLGRLARKFLKMDLMKPDLMKPDAPLTPAPPAIP